MRVVEYVSKVKRKADKPHWTPPRELCDNERMPKRSPILNWLGLAVLVLLVVALILLSRGGEQAAERSSPLAVLASPLSAHESPLAAALLSPLPGTRATAIPSPSPTVAEALVTRIPSPSPTVPAPTATVAAGGLRLTLVHTNDTWGYLLPCG